MRQPIHGQRLRRAAAVQPVQEIVQRLQTVVRTDVCQFGGYRPARAVHPESGQPGFLRALDIQPEVVSDISHLFGPESERVAGVKEDCRIRFDCTQLMRCDIYLEMPGKSDLVKISRPIG